MNEERRELQARLTEYQALRGAIDQAYRQRMWGVGVYAVLSAGLLAAGPATLGGITYIVPVLLALPFVWFATYAERMRVRKEWYILAVLEPCVPGLSWFLARHLWRRHSHESSPLAHLLGRWRYILGILGVYDVVSVCCLYAIWADNSPLWARSVAILGVVLVALDHARMNRIISSGKKWGKAMHDELVRAGHELPPLPESVWPATTEDSEDLGVR